MPEGTRFRFPSNSSFDSISNPFALLLATSIRDYGLIARDTCIILFFIIFIWIGYLLYWSLFVFLLFLCWFSTIYINLFILAPVPVLYAEDPTPYGSDPWPAIFQDFESSIFFSLLLKKKTSISIVIFLINKRYYERNTVARNGSSGSKLGPLGPF